MAKNCSKCGQLTDNFGPDARHKDGLQSQCRVCAGLKGLEWRQKNVDRLRAYDRLRRKSPQDLAAKAVYDREYRKQPKVLCSTRQKLLKKYWPHLSHEGAEKEYTRLFAAQEEKCAICLMPQSQVQKRFGVDHNHVTGEVRGLLCDPCNRGIGLLRDSPVALARAIEYLAPKLRRVA